LPSAVSAAEALTSWHLVEAAEVARQFPGTRIVLNHTGFPWDRSEEGLAAWRRAMETLARQPNVFLKVSEVGLKDAPWDYDRDRGEPRGSAPPTPPCVRVRTRRFEKLR
jgi:predicted TIM-barrel fold metal-dependent hydrolase